MYIYIFSHQVYIYIYVYVRILMITPHMYIYILYFTICIYYVCTMYFVGAHVHMAMCSHDRSGHKAYHGTLWVSCRSTRPYQENCQQL